MERFSITLYPFFIRVKRMMFLSFLQHFWAFLIFRALVGVGEASYSTVAPTIIADLFHADKRTKVLMVFNAAVPCGR